MKEIGAQNRNVYSYTQLTSSHEIPSALAWFVSSQACKQRFISQSALDSYSNEVSVESLNDLDADVEGSITDRSPVYGQFAVNLR